MSKMKSIETAAEENDGPIVLVGEQIPKARLLILRSALKIELSGMKVRRGYSAYASIKSEFGLKGTKQSVFDQFSKYVTEQTGVA